MTSETVTSGSQANMAQLWACARTAVGDRQRRTELAPGNGPICTETSLLLLYLHAQRLLQKNRKLGKGSNPHRTSADHAACRCPYFMTSTSLTQHFTAVTQVEDEDVVTGPSRHTAVKADPIPRCK